MLSKSKGSDILKLYLAVTKHAINVVLIRENDRTQYPIYYTSKVLHNAETHYSSLEKLEYTLVMPARKLRPYFLEHCIGVLTNSTLRQTLQKPDTSKRMVRWVVELGQFDIKYRPRTSIKGQALIVAKFSNEPKRESPPEVP